MFLLYGPRGTRHGPRSGAETSFWSHCPCSSVLSKPQGPNSPGSREQALTSEVSEGVMPTVRRAQEWRGGEQVKGEPGDLQGLWAVSEP